MSTRLRPRLHVVVEPATGAALGEVRTAEADEIRAGVLQAQQAQHHWMGRNCKERADLLGRWRRLIIEQSAVIADLLSRENGKPLHEALLHEVVALAETLNYHRETAPRLMQDQPTVPRWYKHRTHVTRRRPRGVAAIIAPFNFPLLIAASDAAAALVMGCAAVIKPSPFCPLTISRVVDLAYQAGIPQSMLQVVHGDGEVGQALISSGVDHVIFTGSIDNGRAIARHCGELLVPCTLELGGNCPLIVLDDADLDRTARAVAVGAFTNSGQSCLAVGRVLVPRSIAGQLVERLEPLIHRLRQGNPNSTEVDLGALTTRHQLLRCRQHTDQAVALGARPIVGKASTVTTGNFYPPTLLLDCSRETDAFREETFGPVLPVVAYDDLDSVIATLNQDRYGLAAYVFGSDVERTRAVAQALDYGQVVIDQVLLTYTCPEVPLSGRRESGIGVVHGAEGLLAHTTPTVIGTPRFRLPTALEWAWSDPKHAQTLAQGYLATNQALTGLLTWTAKKD